MKRGVAERVDAHRWEALTFEDFTSSRFQRIRPIREFQDAGLLEDDLRPPDVGDAGTPPAG